jgi:transcriptional regulator with XRE-family HTH domain
MEITPTIRAEIEKYLKRKGMSKTEFGHITGLNPGTMSGIVTGNRSISVNQLDRITVGMELPQGYFYNRYIEECLADSAPNFRKIRPLLYRCAKLDRLDCVERVVHLLLENAIYYLPFLFEVAEDLFKDGHHEAAALLYKNVAESEKNQHSERFAICQYRLFKISVGKDQTINLKAAILFEPYVERLDEVDQLDGLKDLANIYRSLGYWDKVYEFAQEMGRKGKIQYHMNRNPERKEQEPQKKPSRPLFVYIAYSDLLCAGVCEAREDYEQALQYTYAYADLSWVTETDADTKHWVNLFQHWAEGNTYVNKLLSGDTSVLEDYVEYIAATSDNAEGEKITKLLNVMIAANRYHIDVDDVLSRFEVDINSLAQLPASTDMYTQQVLPEYFAYFGYELAHYYLHRGYYDDGFKCLMYAMVNYHILNNETYFINCMGLFVHFRAYVAPETKAECLNLIEKVWLKNVKKNDSINRRN